MTEAERIAEWRSYYIDRLLSCPLKLQIKEIRQCIIDFMDVTEQTGVDAALTRALETFDWELGSDPVS